MFHFVFHMMDAALVLSLVVIGISCYYWFVTNNDEAHRKLSKIPGPNIWPVIGNLHFLNRRRAPWNKVWHMANQYGPVMRLQLGSIPVVVLNSYDAIYSGLVTQGKKVMARPPLPRIGLAFPNFADIIFSQPNEQWKILRRAFLHTFKYYGGGKSHLEPVIMDTLQEFLTELRESDQEPIDPHPLISRYFANIIYVLCFGKKTSSLKLINTFQNDLIENLNLFGNGIEVDVWPWYRRLGFGQKVIKTLEEVASNSKTIWESDGRNTDVNPNVVPFTVDEGKIREPHFAATLKAIIAANSDQGMVEQHAQLTIADSITGGVNTSTNVLHYFFNILLHYPAVQERLHRELDDVLGGDKYATVTSEMKDRLHYVQATVYELQRYLTVLPFGIPHATQEEVVIEGHTIPGGVVVLVNAWYLHHDNHWDEPFQFKPERYLDDGGRFVPADHPNRKRSMPFGAGPRVCAGKFLALNRYFVTIGTVMRHFSVQPDPARGLTTCDPRDGLAGIFNRGQPYSARFVPRI